MGRTGLGKTVEGFPDLEELVGKHRANWPDADVTRIRDAYWFAREKLGDAGAPYRGSFFETSYDTAEWLTQVHGSEELIVTALVHHAPTDGNASYEEVEKRFGSEVGKLVKQLTAYGLFEDMQRAGRNHVEKIMLSMTKDLRLVVHSLCERVAVLQRLDNYPEGIRKKMAKEALDIYAPLAAKLGIWLLRNALEDAAFRELHPTEYHQLKERVDDALNDLRVVGEAAEALLREELQRQGVKARIDTRAKHLYGIQKKMLNKKIPLEQVYDLYALRVITETEEDCYNVLGVLHSLWKPLPHEFDDYIAKPKANGYKSIHTAIALQPGMHAEVQIRTEEMHYMAEYGLASHWRYKGEKEQREHEKKLEWIRQWVQWHMRAAEASGLGEARADFFESNLHVYTPRGDVVELPVGATALDFAYAVHSELGNKCHKVKVNRRLVPLDYGLEDGDQIEVITSDKQFPKVSWLSFVKTLKAAKRIRSALELQRQPQGKGVLVPQQNRTIIQGPNRGVRMARCCNPVPGDPIVGLQTTKRKIIVHVEGCEELKRHRTGQNMMGLEWDRKVAGEYAVEVGVTAHDRPGLLSDLLQGMGQEGAKVLEANAKTVSQGTIVCKFTLKVDDIKRLDRVVQQLSRVANVDNVYRF